MGLLEPCNLGSFQVTQDCVLGWRLASGREDGRQEDGKTGRWVRHFGSEMQAPGFISVESYYILLVYTIEIARRELQLETQEQIGRSRQPQP